MTAAKFLIQERHYQGLRQWRSDRYGWQSRVQKSPWKTVAWVLRDFSEAKRLCGALSKNGLREYRITYRGKTAWEE